jgi:hypothetical protein
MYDILFPPRHREKKSLLFCRLEEFQVDQSFDVCTTTFGLAWGSYFQNGGLTTSESLPVNPDDNFGLELYDQITAVEDYYVSCGMP